eukprot:1186758-Prorocentrum_minimum.AAC.3
MFIIESHGFDAGSGPSFIVGVAFLTLCVRRLVPGGRARNGGDNEARARAGGGAAWGRQESVSDHGGVPGGSARVRPRVGDPLASEGGGGGGGAGGGAGGGQSQPAKCHRLHPPHGGRGGGHLQRRGDGQAAGKLRSFFSFSTPRLDMKSLLATRRGAPREVSTPDD